jgi:hypothetical protein
MRIGIEKLAWLVSGEKGDATLGDLAKRHGVTTERIADALDVLKIRQGIPTQIPAVPWHEDPPKPEPVPGRTPCSNGFHWIGQSFAWCDRCGLPAWEHAGMAKLPDGASPFGNAEFILDPWKPGQAEACRQKWEPDLIARNADRERTGVSR